MTAPASPRDCVSHRGASEAIGHFLSCTSGGCVNVVSRYASRRWRTPTMRSGGASYGGRDGNVVLGIVLSVVLSSRVERPPARIPSLGAVRASILGRSGWERRPFLQLTAGDSSDGDEKVFVLVDVRQCTSMAPLDMSKLSGPASCRRSAGGHSPPRRRCAPPAWKQPRCTTR